MTFAVAVRPHQRVLMGGPGSPPRQLFRLGSGVTRRWEASSECTTRNDAYRSFSPSLSVS